MIIGAFLMERAITTTTKCAISPTASKKTTFHCFEYLVNGMIKGPFHRRCKNIPVASQELEAANQMPSQAVRTADCQRKRKNLIISISCI